jgi:hypothetical protein
VANLERLFLSTDRPLLERPEKHEGVFRGGLSPSSTKRVLAQMGLQVFSAAAPHPFIQTSGSSYEVARHAHS